MIDIGASRVALTLLLFSEQIALVWLTRNCRKRRRVHNAGHDMLVALWAFYIALLILIALSPDPRWRVQNLIGLVLVGLGILLRVWALRVIGHSYAPAITVYERQTLVSHGAYARFAHPLYMGLSIELIGLGVFNGSSVGYVLAVAGIVATRIQIAREERLLTTTYGAEYINYRWRVWDFGDRYRGIR